MVLPSPAAPRRRTRQRSIPRRSNSNIRKSRFLIIGLTVFFLSILGFWGCVLFISPGLATRSYTPMNEPMQPAFSSEKKKIRGGRGDKEVRSLHSNNQKKGRNGPKISSQSQKPHVVGMYAYQLNEVDRTTLKQHSKNYLPPYMYLIERIDRNLLLHSPIQTLRRIRRHDHYSRDTSLSDLVSNYKLAIAGSTSSYIKSEDPLNHLMLSSDSRERLRDIAEDSEDYDEARADPLNDEKCEATPKNEKWMLHSFPSCNLMHENDMVTSLRKRKTRLLGNGYWRDVWPVLDTEQSSSRLRQQKKVALKTIRWEHDYTERNYDRHVRDAIVSERLTSSPRVTAIYSFCGNSGYYEFATGGSLSDQIEKHYAAQIDAESEERMGKKNDAKGKDDRLMDQYQKLSLAYQAAAGLADLHDTDAMRDENGNIISASMVHADITVDQFINIGGVFKLNDFNRCRFMRRYRNSTMTEGGDGKPCGFFVGNNPGNGRSPEEYAYEVETEKIDVYSLGNIFYTILTIMDPFEDEDNKKVKKAVIRGERPEIPVTILKSVDPVDVILRKVINQCWEHKPEDRPRAREVANFLSKELSALKDGKKMK